MIQRFAAPIGLLLLAATLAGIEYRTARDSTTAENHWMIDPAGYQAGFTSDLLPGPNAITPKRLRVSAALENAWMEATVTVLAPDGTVFDSSTLYIDYFAQPRNGLHWTWGTPVASATIQVPANGFRLRVVAQPEPATMDPVPLQVELLPVVRGSHARLLGCALAGVFGLSLLLKALAAEGVFRPRTARHAASPPTIQAQPIDNTEPFGLNRLHFIDGLRGIAAMAVLICHLFVAQFLPSVRLIEQAISRSAVEFLQGGKLGVEIFFVLSGFVIAYSIRRYRVTPGFIGHFIARRFLRLDPPYYVGIFLGIILMAMPLADSLHVALDYFQNWRGLVINAIYLQDLLGYRSPIGTVAWTLCLEVQFYLALVTLTGVSQWVGRRFARQDPRGRVERASWWLLLGSLGAVSVAYWFPDQDHFNFFGTWHRFFLGVLTFRCLATKSSPYPLAALLVLLAVTSTGFSDPRGVTAAATAASILIAGKVNALGHWLNGRVWQFLGRLSYSLYLFHVVLALPLLAWIWTRLPHTLTFAILLVPFGIIVAVTCAWVMHVLIERPSMMLSHRVRYTKVPNVRTMKSNPARNEIAPG